MNLSKNFAGIGDEYAAFETSDILLQPIPYDGTSTWGKGADKGVEVFLEAAENMELYDIETDSEVYRQGICLLPPILEKSSPEKLYEVVLNKTAQLLETGKFLSFIGGEHSISIGIIEAFRKKYPELGVLQMDAHADLRPEYNGSRFNHACALHQAAKHSQLVQAGIRSMDYSEKQFLNPAKCFFAEDMYGTDKWMDESIKLLPDDVYLSFDLDVLDPSIMPATGTPEPGGLDWNTTIRYLRKLFEQKNIVGFDIVEFAPIEGLRAPGFLVAKLYYKLLSYKFINDGK